MSVHEDGDHTATAGCCRNKASHRVCDVADGHLGSSTYKGNGSRARTSRCGEQRRTVSRLLLLVSAALLVPGARGQVYSLGLAEDSACDGLSTWSNECRMDYGQVIPGHKVGLFQDGVPCCGDAQVAVNVRVQKLGVEQTVSGFVDKDSSPGAAETAMTITFDGLQLTGTTIGSNFSMTFSAFFQGRLLVYTSSQFSVFPNGIALQQPWGTWPGATSTASTTEPIMVGNELPQVLVALTLQGSSGNSTAVSLTAEDSFYVGARLFHKDDNSDISEGGLLGDKVQLVSGGVAAFNNLKVRRYAGKGYKLSFYLLRSEKPCTASVIRLQCEEWQRSRGLDGGLGGYELELTTDAITITPDSMSVSTFGVHPHIIRVDESINSYRIQFFDSTNPSVALSGFTQEDGFSVSVSLYNSAGTEVSGSLLGSKTQEVNGSSAEFQDLYIVGRAGDGFSLQFKPSWYSQCAANLFDSSCQGGCCVQSQRFFVYPYRMEVAPTVLDIAEGGTTVSITVNFLDFAGSVLSVISQSDGLVVNAFLRKRNLLVGGMAGTTSVAVNGGVAAFNGFTISDNAGSGFTILFVEEKSQMSGSSNLFAIFPASVTLTTNQVDTTAGGGLQDAVLSFFGTASQLLSYIEEKDRFLVTVEIQQYSGSVWQSRNTGPGNTTIAGGQARIQGSEYSVYGVSKAALDFRILFTLNRPGLSAGALNVTSNPFSVGPDNLQVVFTNGTQFNDIEVDQPSAVNISVYLQDAENNRIEAEAEGVPVSVSLSKNGTDFSSSLSTGSQIVDASFAAKFAGLTVSNPAAGSDFQLQFAVPTGQTASVGTFKVFPSKIVISVVPPALDTVAGAYLPGPIQVALQSSENSTLTGISSESSHFDVEARVVCTDVVSVSPYVESPIFGVADFSNRIEIVGVFGQCVVQFGLTGFLLSAVSTPTFQVDPPAMVLTGFFNTSIQVGEVVKVNLTMTDQDGDNNGNGVEDDALVQKPGPTYTVSVSLLKGSLPVSHYLAGNLTATVSDSIAIFSNIRFQAVTGTDFVLQFTLPSLSGTLTVNSSRFSISPDFLDVQAVSSALSDTTLKPIAVITRQRNGAFIAVEANENFQIQAKLFDRNNALVPTCSVSVTSSCLSGTTTLTIANGTVSFADLAIRDRAGNDFYFVFEMLNGGPTGTSALFSIYPGALVIAEGVVDFTGRYIVSNRDAGVYSTRLETPGTGAHASLVTAADGFNISVALFQRGVDVSNYLTGTLSLVAEYNQTTQMHATFTDISIQGFSGSNLVFRFKFEDPQATNDLVVETGSFRAVPYALRVREACYNGNSISSGGSVPFGAPPLVCSGSDQSASAQFGTFGYLTGYYYYLANQVVGPLLRNVRGRARVPTVTVLAIDLYENVLSMVDSQDSLRINAGLFQGTQDFTSVLSGTTSRSASAGAAEFNDLIVGTIPGCSPNCSVVLRFSLDGVLCTDTWCTNITMDLRDEVVIPPHELGSHPGYPGRTTVAGTAVISAGTGFVPAEEDIFKEAITSYGGVPYQARADVSIASVTNHSAGGSGLEVSFTVQARTYAAANTMQIKLTEILGAGDSIFLGICSKLNQTGFPLCGESVILKAPLTRTTESLLFASRVSTPTFNPAGSAASCLNEGNCFQANISSFGSFTVIISVEDGATIYYTADTCPTPTAYCTSTGSVPSTSSANVSSGTELAVFQSTPPSTILSAGLTTQSAFTNPGQASAFGATGTRDVGILPRVFTIKAFGVQSGKKQGFQASATYVLPTQASTPEITLLQKYVLGWCNGTHRSNGSSIILGSCSELHANASFCTAADAVPCLATGQICTSGSAGRTIDSHGYYDGSYEEYTPVSLTAAYAPNLDRLFVTSVTALGFTNEGSLPTSRKILVGRNGQQGGVYPALEVLSVSLSDNSLEIRPDLTTLAENIGSTVELLEVCNITDAASSVRLSIATATTSSRIHFQLDGALPSGSSNFVTGSSSLFFKLPANLRAVAAQDGLANSFLLSADFVSPCGDGVVEGGEQCDDSNTISGDGCSAECLVE